MRELAIVHLPTNSTKTPLAIHVEVRNFVCSSHSSTLTSNCSLLTNFLSLAILALVLIVSWLILPLLATTPTSHLPPTLQVTPNDCIGPPFVNHNPNHLQVWAPNVNGLLTKDGYAAWHKMCGTLQSYGISAIAISKTNIDFWRRTSEKKSQ